MTSLPASLYASSAAIRRALKAAEAHGMKPAGLRIEPGGAITVFDASTAPQRDEFEEWRASQQEPNDFDR